MTADEIYAEITEERFVKEVFIRSYNNLDCTNGIKKLIEANDY